MGKIAILFAGQGAQTIGMGKDFYDAYTFIQQDYQKASSILGTDLTKICFEPNDLINQTIYTQPSVLMTSLSIYHALLKETKIKADIVAGFSLGEYSALYASGVFDFETIIHLIKLRAEWMQEAALKTKGAMAAIIGMERTVLETLCESESQDDEFVRIANYNSPNQLVVGGTVKAVMSLCEQAKSYGAKRAMMLNVSGGFHTPLMHEAAIKMCEKIKTIPHQTNHTPIIMNCNARYLEIDHLADWMQKQIESSVYFEDTVHHMIEDGVDTFIEIGPGSVLSGLIRKIDGTKKVISLDHLSDLEQLKGVM